MRPDSIPSHDDRRQAEAVRAACVRAALEAFEDASISGLCCTGAWECAVGAMRTLDLEAVLRGPSPEGEGSPPGSRRGPGPA